MDLEPKMELITVQSGAVILLEANQPDLLRFEAKICTLLAREAHLDSF